MKMKDCARCGETPTVDHWRKPIPTDEYDFSVSCGSCNDGEPGQVIGWGRTREEAIEDWNTVQRCVDCWSEGEDLNSEGICSTCDRLAKRAKEEEARRDGP